VVLLKGGIEMAKANQLYLDFDTPAQLPPKSPGAGRQTSRDAYEGTNIVRDADRIANYLKLLGARGATRDEIAVGLGIALATVCGRARDLLDAERIYESTLKRPTRTGSLAVVLIYQPQPPATGK
jgi:hypothetical protein